MSVWVKYAVLGGTALMAVALSAVQTHTDRSVFARYLGATNPVAAMGSGATTGRGVDAAGDGG